MLICEGSTGCESTTSVGSFSIRRRRCVRRAQRFKELIGVTPKRLARTHRFTATVFSIDPAGPIDWADLASGAGYFDQARFGHELREFTGLTPTRYVEVRQRFLRGHPAHTLDGWPLPAD